VNVGDHIIQVTQFKYLGFILSTKKTWVHKAKWQRNKSRCKSLYSSWMVEMEKSLKCFLWYKCVV